MSVAVDLIIANMLNVMVFALTIFHVYYEFSRAETLIVISGWPFFFPTLNILVH